MIHPALVSVGASGAIFELFGMFLVMIIVKNFDQPVAFVPILNLVLFVVMNLLIGASKAGIDNAAHIGGLLMGMVLGAVHVLTAPKARVRR